jgi:hypothetical protein
MKLKILLAVAGVAIASSFGILSAGASGLVPHRAVYDLLPMDEIARQNGLRGRMVYEFRGDTCDGYSTTVRFVLESLNREGETLVNDIRSTSFEDPAYEVFQSATSTYVNNALSGEMRGTASRSDEGFDVAHSKPDESTGKIAGPARLPTEFMEHILAQARIGEKFVSSRIIDGSPDGVEVLFSTAIVGTYHDGLGETENEPEINKLAGMTAGYWPMTVSYFQQEGETRGEDEPIYAVKFLVYENGISREMTLLYPEFSLQGRLINLKLYDVIDCSE